MSTLSQQGTLPRCPPLLRLPLVTPEAREAHCGAAVSEGITSIATVHDSFGCLPSRAERFRKVIREEFVRMYEDNDVLQGILDWARKDLGANTKGLHDEPPARGSLDIKKVLDAEFAFG
jgi:DNA-directed RNA polymerase, mitochondrial